MYIYIVYHGTRGRQRQRQKLLGAMKVIVGLAYFNDGSMTIADLGLAEPCQGNFSVIYQHENKSICVEIHFLIH